MRGCPLLSLGPSTLAPAGVYQDGSCHFSGIPAKINLSISISHSALPLYGGLGGAEASLDVPTANKATEISISTAGGSNPWRRLREAPSQQQDHANYPSSVCVAQMREDADY